MRKGKKNGEEIAAVRENTVSGGEDLYRFESITKISEVFGSGQHLGAHGQLIPNDRGGFQFS
ncbi:MAG: hypothetical protein U0931_30085 [Vulcanimicrobiota bacterium]